MRAKLLPKFRDAMKEMGIDKFKIRVEDAIEKAEKKAQDDAITEAVANAKAKAMPRAGLMGFFV